MFFPPTALFLLPNCRVVYGVINYKAIIGCAWPVSRRARNAFYCTRDTLPSLLLTIAGRLKLTRRFSNCPRGVSLRTRRRTADHDNGAFHDAALMAVLLTKFQFSQLSKMANRRPHFSQSVIAGKKR
jgi:hypothetical protein